MAMDPEFLPALRFERLTPFYDGVIALTTRERTFRRRVVEQAAIGDGMRVLDIGAGTGTLAALVGERHPGARVTGLDADPAMLARARAKAPRASFDEGLSYELPYPDASFDRVLSSLFFHHLRPRDKRRTLAEARRVLRPGGELHVADWGRAAGALMRVLAVSIGCSTARRPPATASPGGCPRSWPRRASRTSAGAARCTPRSARWR